MLQEFGPSLYYADGPQVRFYGFPYPTRMAVVRLGDGGLWIWSPIRLSDDLARAVDAIGPVRHIVTPNKLHHLFLEAWVRRWPDAVLHAPPGLARKVPQLHFGAPLLDSPDPAWAADLDQVIFHGSFVLTEVAFFHRLSRTTIIGDLIQKPVPADAGGLKRLFARLGGIGGEHGSTPRDWRLSFVRRAQARKARQTVLDWHPRQLLVAHGPCARTDATTIIAQALAWM